MLSQARFEAVLQFLMQETLTRLIGASDTHLIYHAAALALNGKGVMLCGKSGSGKSTLTAWLLTQGFDYLTDEAVSMPVGEDVIHGFARSLALKRGSAFLWQGWQKEKLEAEEFLQFKDGSAWIAPALFRDHVPPAGVIPRVVIFPRYAAGAEFSARKLTPAGTLFHLMQSLVNARNFESRGMKETARLAKQVKAFELKYSNLESAAQWIRSLI